jgi:hypothetical protein
VCREGGDCGKNCLLKDNAWIVIEVYLVIDFLLGHMVVIGAYWIKNSCLNKRVEHDIAK